MWDKRATVLGPFRGFLERLNGRDDLRQQGVVRFNFVERFLRFDFGRLVRIGFPKFLKPTR